MKLAPILAGLLLACGPVLADPAAPDVIPASRAGAHIGEVATVTGKVNEVVTSRSGTIFIDLDGYYPTNLFTGVIFPDDRSQIGDPSGLENRTIAITGKVQNYHGRPEIIIKSSSQIAPH